MCIPCPQFCVIEGVIPAAQVDAVRESVLVGRRRLQAERMTARERQQGGGSSGAGIKQDAEINPNGQPDPIRPPEPPPEINDIACNELFAEHLAEPRLMAVAKTMLDTHLRIAQTEVNKSRAPGATLASLERRGWHSDWPHDLTAYNANSLEPWKHCGAVAQPFPDVCMALSTVWYLGPDDVTPFNGGTWVVPRSHLDPRNPRGPDDGIDARSPIPGEFQVSGAAGSVFVQDTRLWHAGAPNQSEQPRHAAVCRYAPWWLSVEEFGNPGRCRTFVPRDVFARLKPEVQLLYRHCAEQSGDFIQPEGQRKAYRAKFVDQPHLRAPDRFGDNIGLVVGGMDREQWRAARGGDLAIAKL